MMWLVILVVVWFGCAALLLFALLCDREHAAEGSRKHSTDEIRYPTRVSDHAEIRRELTTKTAIDFVMRPRGSSGCYPKPSARPKRAV